MKSNDLKKLTEAYNQISSDSVHDTWRSVDSNHVFDEPHNSTYTTNGINQKTIAKMCLDDDAIAEAVQLTIDEIFAKKGTLTESDYDLLAREARAEAAARLADVLRYVDFKGIAIKLAKYTLDTIAPEPRSRRRR